MAIEVPVLRQAARFANEGSAIKGLAEDNGVSERAAKRWYGSGTLPLKRLLPTASGLDRRLARIEARARLLRQRLKREIEHAERRAAASALDRRRNRPMAHASPVQAIYRRA